MTKNLELFRGFWERAIWQENNVMCLDSRKYAIKTFPFLHCPITLCWPSIYKCTSTGNILNSAWKVYRFWHWTSIYLTFLILFYALCWHSFFSCVQVIVFLFNELIEMTIYNVIHKGACTRKKHIVKWSYDIFLINCVKCIIIHPLLAQCTGFTPSDTAFCWILFLSN